MKSKTKYNLTDSEIRQIFKNNNIENITEIKALGNGMFNAVYNICTPNKEYVLKVAPKHNQNVMTYEKDMLKTELYWYDKINQNTNISTPTIYFSSINNDNTINANYFVMEKINGVERSKVKLISNQKDKMSAQIIGEFHNVKNDKYGYIQNTLHDNWYDAFRSMVENTIIDAEKMGKKTKNGEKLLKYIDEYKSILQNCECTMVNYDLWDANIICNKNKFTVIDPERTFWGDPIFDFICIDSFTKPLITKKQSIDMHNSISDVKIEINRESKIRYAFAQGYMALIMEVERYYRFSPLSEGWLFDTLASNSTYKQAFKVLENEK